MRLVVMKLVYTRANLSIKFGLTLLKLINDLNSF